MEEVRQQNSTISSGAAHQRRGERGAPAGSAAGKGLQRRAREGVSHLMFGRAGCAATLVTERAAFGSGDFYSAFIRLGGKGVGYLAVEPQECGNRMGHDMPPQYCNKKVVVYIPHRGMAQPDGATTLLELLETDLTHFLQSRQRQCRRKTWPPRALACCFCAESVPPPPPCTLLCG